MTFEQNEALGYGHFSDFFGMKLPIWVRLTSKLVCISKIMLMKGKKKLKSISKSLAKMEINWHKLGQMPLWRMNIKWA